MRVRVRRSETGRPGANPGANLTPRSPNPDPRRPAPPRYINDPADHGKRNFDLGANEVGSLSPSFIAPNTPEGERRIV